MFFPECSFLPLLYFFLWLSPFFSLFYWVEMIRVQQIIFWFRHMSWSPLTRHFWVVRCPFAPPLTIHGSRWRVQLSVGGKNFALNEEYLSRRKYKGMKILNFKYLFHLLGTCLRVRSSSPNLVWCFYFWVYTFLITFYRSPSLVARG